MTQYKCPAGEECVSSTPEHGKGMVQILRDRWNHGKWPGLPCVFGDGSHKGGGGPTGHICCQHDRRDDDEYRQPGRVGELYHTLGRWADHYVTHDRYFLCRVPHRGPAYPWCATWWGGRCAHSGAKPLRFGPYSP